MLSAHAKSGASEVILEAKVTRANGTVEHLGEIAHYYRNPWKRLRWRIHKWRLL